MKRYDKFKDRHPRCKGTMEDIRGYEGFYQASSFGNIKSIRRHGVKNDRIIKQINRGGYRSVHLYKNGVRHDYSTSRLIAITFINIIKGKPEVNHKDGNKANNCVNNLEWSTRSENMIHAWGSGLLADRYGEHNGNSKLKESDIIQILKSNERYKYLANKYNVCIGTIEQIRNKKHGNI